MLRWYRNSITIAGVTNVSETDSNLLNGPFNVVIVWSYTLDVTDLNNNRIQKFLKNEFNGITVAR